MRLLLLDFATRYHASCRSRRTTYFQGKTITLQVGSGAGGRQDRIARTLAKYLTKYTPGKPSIRYPKSIRRAGHTGDFESS